MTTSFDCLYSFRRCPYAMRARLGVLFAGLQVGLREVTLKNKPAQMLAISPKGTVPVLELADGAVIEESRDIMVWALEQQDPQGLLEATIFPKANDLIEQNDNEFKYWLDRYKYADRHPELSPNEHRANTEPMITDLNDQLKDRSFLLGEQLTLVDVALFPFIRQYAHVDKKWFDQLPVPHLQRWLSHFLNSPLFQVVMTKFKLFNDGFVYEFPSGRLLKSP